MKNQDLFLQFSKDFQELLDSHNKKDESIDKYSRICLLPVLDPEGFVNCNEQRKFDNRKYLADNFEIKNSPHFEKIVRRFCENTIFYEYFCFLNRNRIGFTGTKPGSQEMIQDMEELTLSLVSNYLEFHGNLDYDEEAFAETYNAMENFVYNDHLYLYSFMPVYGLTGDFSSITIDDTTSIKLLSPNEYARITDIDIADNISFRPHKNYWKLKYGIYLKLKRIDGKAPSTSTQIDLCQTILKCLRLFSPGFISLGALYPYCPSIWKRDDLPPRTGFENPPDIKPTLQLNSTERDKFLKLVNKFKTIPSNADSTRYFFFALKKFNDTYADNSIDEKITNLTIALEFLLTSGPGEIQFKLSQRSAMLLGQNESDREYIWNFVKRCYEIRSDMVHGKTRKKTEVSGKIISEQEILFELENFLRESIRKTISILNSGNSKNNLINILDECVINRNKITELNYILKDSW